MGKNLTLTHKITLAAMLLAFNVVSTRLLGMAQAFPLFAFNRLSLATSLTMFSSILLGPLFGAIVGVGGDAIGWLIMGQWTGPFNIYISMYYALIGIIPYFIVRYFGKALDSDKSICPLFLIIALMAVAFIVLLWVLPGFTTRFEQLGIEELPCKIIFTAIICILSLAIILFLFYFQRKKNLQGLGSIYWTCLLVEGLTIVLKPVCFWLYCLTFLGTDLVGGFGVPFELLVLISLLFAFPDILINIFFLRLCFWVYGRALGSNRHE